MADLPRLEKLKLLNKNNLCACPVPTRMNTCLFYDVTNYRILP